MKKNSHTACCPTAAFLLALALVASLGACTKDLGVDTQAFACDDDRDCAAGYRCAPVDGRSYHGICEWGSGSDGDVVDPDGGGGDTVIPPPPDFLCKSCSEDQGCGDAEDRCTTLPEGRFCSTACAGNNDCPSGFFCFEMTPDSRQCVPALFNTCASCLQTPCPAGQYCDQISGACAARVETCGRCVRDTECGFGARCYAFGPTDRRCVPSCGMGDACPANSACETLGRDQGTEGVRACIPTGSECCVGDDCAACDCAPGEFCVPATGSCVECMIDMHCPMDRPRCEGGSCVSPVCEWPAPYPCQQSASRCCECLSDEDCFNVGVPGGDDPIGPMGVCDLSLGECIDDPGQCGICQDPYPVCVYASGTANCVECGEDEHCAPDCTCDVMSFSCRDDLSGGYCGQAGETCPFSCVVDADCPVSLGGLALDCDALSGCCYNTAGACDNVTAFCPVAGSACVPLYDVMLEGSNGGGAPGSGSFDAPDGFCSCTMSMECANFSMDYETVPTVPTEGPVVCCPEGLFCLDPYEVRRFIDGDVEQLNPIFTGGTGICFAPGHVYLPMGQ